MAGLLDVRDITKSYGGVQAVRSCSFSVSEFHHRSHRA
jgi:ABC-type branched-subunit amino acid transport system ATPase component